MHIQLDFCTDKLFVLPPQDIYFCAIIAVEYCKFPKEELNIVSELKYVGY